MSWKERKALFLLPGVTKKKRENIGKIISHCLNSFHARVCVCVCVGKRVYGRLCVGGGHLTSCYTVVKRLKVSGIQPTTKTTAFLFDSFP